MWKRQIRTKITFIVLPMHRLLMWTGFLFDVVGNQQVNKTMASRIATCQCARVTLSRTLPSPFKVGDAVDASLLGNVHRDLTSLVYLSVSLFCTYITFTIESCWMPLGPVLESGYFVGSDFFVLVESIDLQLCFLPSWVRWQFQTLFFWRRS